MSTSFWGRKLTEESAKMYVEARHGFCKIFGHFRRPVGYILESRFQRNLKAGWFRNFVARSLPSQVKESMLDPIVAFLSSPQKL